MAHGMYWQMRYVHRVLLEKPEEQSQLRRAKHRREDNIKIDLKQDGRECPGLIWLWTGKIGWIT
jgi:hypothetical protein